MENLALACLPCNAYKGANIAGYDPQSDEVERLFNPRLDRWNDHFAWDGAVLTALTAIGRTTIEVLRINEDERVVHRQFLIDAALFPPER